MLLVALFQAVPNRQLMHLEQVHRVLGYRATLIFWLH
jgi:hypothetical protein